MDSRRIEGEGPVASIPPDRLHDRLARGDGAFLLDVRPAGAVRTWRIEGPGVEHRHVPAAELREELAAGHVERLPDDRTLTVVCADGDIAHGIARALSQAGYDANYLEGGMRGWAGVYAYAELDADVDATVAQYRRPATGCLSYLVVSDGEAAVVDPLHAFAREYVRDARALGANLAYAMDTRVHDDHVSGVRALADRGDATAVVPAAAAEHGVQYGHPFETLADGGTLAVGAVELRAVPGPDHVAGASGYRVGDVAFTGDAVGAPPTTDGDVSDAMWGTGRREAEPSTDDGLGSTLLSLSDDTILAPAHARLLAAPSDDGTYTVRLGVAKGSVRTRAEDSETSAGSVDTGRTPRPAVAEEIRAVNLGERTVSDARVVELELGALATDGERDEL